MKDIRIETKRFLLRSLLKDDVSASYLSWINGSGSSAYIEYAGQDRTLEELRIYVLQKSGEKSALFLGIFTLDTLQHIGNIKYEPVDFHNKTAMMGILVGEESWRGRGVAQEVIEASAMWLYKKYKIESVLLGVDTSNVYAIKAYKKIGFQNQDGVSTQSNSQIMHLKLPLGNT